MPAESVNWLPGLVVLAAGLVAGFVLLRGVRRRGEPAPAASEPLEQRDLMARRDALIEQLHELDELAPKRDHAQLAHRRWELEHEAARVLRDLDRLPRASLAPAPGGAAARPASPDRAVQRGFLWGTGTAAAVGLLLFLVYRSATERGPGGSLTGEIPGTARSAGPGADAELAALQAAVERTPDDVDARMALARAALARQDLMEVYNQTRAVLSRSPGHPRALSYQALVRLAMGQPDEAEAMLTQALAADPDLLDGYVHLSLVHMRMGRVEAAQADIEEAARRHPAQAARLRSLWSDMRARSEAAPESAPVDGSRPAQERGVSGTLVLAPPLEGRVPAGAVIFIVVRAEGVTGGPPVAAQRLAASSFPMAFHIGAADSMMGAELPDRVRIEARVDSDGDPVTRDPADPRATAESVRLGTTELRLVLGK